MVKGEQVRTGFGVTESVTGVVGEALMTSGHVWSDRPSGVTTRHV